MVNRHLEEGVDSFYDVLTLLAEYFFWSIYIVSKLAALRIALHWDRMPLQCFLVEVTLVRSINGTPTMSEPDTQCGASALCDLPRPVFNTK
jgi:hypothetical protein